MRSFALVLLAVAGLAAGCGGQPQAPEKSAPPSATGTLLVTQQGASPEQTMWFTRVETTTSAPVVEKAYPAGRISSNHFLVPGNYRLMAWYRSCSGSCPQTGEHGLGPLEQVCGIPVLIVSGQTMTATVTIEAEDGCSISVSPS